MAELSSFREKNNKTLVDLSRSFSRQDGAPAARNYLVYSEHKLKRVDFLSGGIRRSSYCRQHVCIAAGLVFEAVFGK